MRLNLMGFKRPNKSHPDGDSKIAMALILGFLEFCLAAIALMLISKDPKNSFLFGFSLFRVLLILASLAAGLVSLITAIKAFQGKKWILLTLARKIATWNDFSLVLLLVGCLIALLDPSMLGDFRYGFERLRPILLVVCVLPIQFSLTQPTKLKWKKNPSLWIPISYCILATLVLAGVIVITRLGITPDIVYWNVAGMPLSSAQLVMVFIGIMICLEIITIIKKTVPDRKYKYLDPGLCLLLFVSAIFVWELTPFNGHFFADITWPLNQPFPYSDARGRDLGALSITIGQGISFNEHTVSPLQEVFLAILHGIAGYDYNLITHLQLVLLACIPVVMYLLGKAFNNRLLGLFIAAIVIVRQSNAILLSRMIAGSNPYLLTTEMPTYLTLVVLTGLVFWWLKKSQRSAWIPFFSGAVLGMASLIRVNPFILFPAIPVIALAAMWKTKKKWLVQTIAYMLGFLLLVCPWLFTGISKDGQSFLFQKFYNVVDQRYDPSSLLPPVEDNTFTASLSSSRARMKIATGSNGEDDILFDIYQFPGFVVNHFLHNIVTSILALPDSISPTDQVLKQLALRPYWVENEARLGELKTNQPIALFFNLILLSMGMGWSWKRWKWAGLLPLFIFVMYLLSLGFARVSGSRYIVPVDWVIFFYHGIGLIMIFGWMVKFLGLKIRPEFETIDEIDNLSLPNKKTRWYLIPSLILLVAVAASIPVADNLIPPDTNLCQNNSLINRSITLYDGKLEEVVFLPGRLLYPSITDETLTVTLLTCKGSTELILENFTQSIYSGQLAVAVMKYPIGTGNPEMILAVENDTLVELWER